MIRIGIKLTMILCIWLLEVTVYGGYEDPTARTNVNLKTDLFEKEIEDYGTFEKAMGSLKEQTTQGIASPGNLELITDKPDDEIKAAAGDLSSIRATDLEARGREEVARTSIMEELHVDYTNPLNTEHQKDAIHIADSSGVLLRKLTELFKEFGIDCQTVKGNKVIEPEYYIEIKKEKVKDTLYNQVICESLRNRYLCHDRLMMNCKTKGIQKGIAQSKAVNLGAMDLWNLGVFNGEDYEQWGNTEDAKLVLKIRLDATSIPVIKNWLALKEGVSNDFIDNIKVSYHGGIMFMNLDRRKYGFTTYRIDYEVAKKYEICLVWQEEWIEQCVLN